MLWMWVLGAMKGNVWLTAFVNANRHFFDVRFYLFPKV